MNRVKSHRDVAERWFPELLGKLREEGEKAGREEGRDVGVGSNATRVIEAH